MRVVLSREAQDDLERIAEYIARDSPRQASRFVTELRRQMATIKDMPEAFPVLPAYREAGIRRRPFRDYLIFYNVRGDIANVLHVIHGNRDYEAILSAEQDGRS